MLTTTLSAPPPPLPPYSAFEMHLLDVGGVVFLAAAALELAFLVHYIVVAPAFRSAIGWMFVLRSGSFLLSGIAILLSRLWGPLYPGKPEITLALFVVVLISAGLTYGTFLFERYGRKDGRQHPIHRAQSFARRALGLRERPVVQPCAGEPRPDTRPLRIVGGSGA